MHFFIISQFSTSEIGGRGDSYLNLMQKATRKKEQIKLKVSRRKEIIKIREEINKIETKKRIEKLNEMKSYFFEEIKFINLYPDTSIKREDSNY